MIVQSILEILYLLTKFLLKEVGWVAAPQAGSHRGGGGDEPLCSASSKKTRAPSPEMDAEMDAEQVTQGQPDETLHDVLRQMEEFVQCGHVSEDVLVELRKSLARAHAILDALKKVDKRSMDTIKYEEMKRKLLEESDNFHRTAYLKWASRLVRANN